MSEENQASEPVEVPEKTVEPVEPVAPWSVPESLEPVEVEPPSYDVLKPLEPDMGNLADAMADTLTPTSIPDMDQYFKDLEAPPPGTQEQGTVRVLRPVTSVGLESCPEGMIGFCVNCNLLPCNYMIGRVLRHLLTKNEYGS